MSDEHKPEHAREREITTFTFGKYCGKTEAARAEVSRMYTTDGAVVEAVELRADAAPRGEFRRSRQVRSTRARARRRVEAREQRRAS